MILVQHLYTPRHHLAYRRTLTGEVFGYIIHPTKFSFSPVVPVLHDPLVGPVVVLEVREGWDVFEIEEETVHASESDALEVHFGD